MRAYLFAVFILLFCLSSAWSAQTLSPRTYNKLTDIQEQIDKGLSESARKDLEEELTELAEDLSDNALGLALTLQTHAQIKLQLDDTSTAISLLKKAVAINGLDETTHNQLKMFIAQLLFTQAKYADVVSVLKPWLSQKDKTIAPAAYAMLAAAYYSIEDIKNGLPYIEFACELNKEPKEPWLQMAFSGHYQLKNLNRALDYLNVLIGSFPEKPDYWNQKAGVLQMQEKYKQAATVKELAYKQGYLKSESDIITLVQLLASIDAPYKASVILEDALSKKHITASEKNLRLLYQAWLQAKESKKAIAALTELFKTAKLSKDGLRLLQFHVDAENWNEAISTANDLNRLEISDEEAGKALLYEGIAQYRLGNTRQALAKLGKSTAYEKSRGQAKSWINYIKQVSG